MSRALITIPPMADHTMHRMAQTPVPDVGEVIASESTRQNPVVRRTSQWHIGKGWIA